MPRIYDGPYAAIWREQRRRDRIAWAWLLGYIPGVFLVAGGLGVIIPRVGTFYGTTLGWMAATWWAGHRAASLRCPRCGRPFFIRGLWHNGFTRRCLHCGLPKWASDNRDRVVPPPEPQHSGPRTRRIRRRRWPVGRLAVGALVYWLHRPTWPMVIAGAGAGTYQTLSYERHFLYWVDGHGHRGVDSAFRVTYYSHDRAPGRMRDKARRIAPAL